MAAKIAGLRNRLSDALRQSCCVGRSLHPGLNDRELVPTESRERIRAAYALAHPVGHCLQQFVADRMSERVVDALETVQVEIKDGYLFSRRSVQERCFEPLPQQCAIRQVSQRIVMRH